MDDFWRPLLAGQLEFYWDYGLWPRLQGLTDAEYLWEPVPGCWSVRQQADGSYQLDGGDAPDPPPVTPIAWRMMHLGAGCLVGVLANGTPVPMAGLVLHISREVMHHGGEIGALRDLYRARAGSAGGPCRA